MEITCQTWIEPKIETLEYQCSILGQVMFGGYAVSCEPCGDPTDYAWVVTGSCSVEVEKWALRGL